MTELSELKLLDLLNSSESQFVERKKSMPNTADVRRALVAFANSVGEHEHGILFIGVNDKGEKLGVLNADKVQRDVRAIAENDCCRFI
jgi:predicted HTH transcriptional regulator